MIALLRDLIGPDGTLAMPAFAIDQNPDKIFLVDRAAAYTGMPYEIFRRNPEVKRSNSSVCALGPASMRKYPTCASLPAMRSPASRGL
jgi:aminoglycoside N3'-acetyltransferase